MKTAFLEDVGSGIEVMRIARAQGWFLIRVQFNRKGARVCYLEGK